MHDGPQANLLFFNWGRVLRLARKELREILRDRRTIITLIAMPLLLYPLMSVAFQQFYMASRIIPDAGQEYRIAALTSAEVTAFQKRFDLGQKVWRRQRGPVTPAKGQPKKPMVNSQLVWYGVGFPKPKNEEQRAEGIESLKQALRNGEFDLAIDMPNLNSDKELDDQTDHLVPCKIYFVPNNAMARGALSYIDTMFAAANAENLRERLDVPEAKHRINLPPGATHVTMLSVQRAALDPTGNEGVVSLAALVPLILILMTITGAVYPAIDLTAGEQERGTLEILVAAPVPRFELLAAKYISVVAVAVMNAVVNLVCMAVTVTWSGLGSMLFQEGGLSVLLLVQILALLLLFAAFFSAVLLCLTSFARSFKEAQAYLIPLMLASLAPGIMAMLPGLKLEGILAVLPLVNIVLLARDLFSGDVEPFISSVVVLTTMLYAVAALSLAARVFGGESVLYREQSSWSDLFRRPDEPQPAASIPAALWCLAIMVPVQFGMLALLREMQAAFRFTPALSIAAQVGLNVLLFGLLPAFFLHLGRVQLASGLGLGAPRALGLGAGLLFGASVWPLEVYMLSRSSQLQTVERIGDVMQQIKDAQASVGWGILVVVVVPAILEELFFRGLLFNALKARCGPWLTIGVSSLLFGMTHVALGGALGLERLLPSVLLGLILGTVCWRSGSLWPSMIQHVCHNVILLTLGLHDPGALKDIKWEWLAGGGLGVVVGIILLFPLTARETPDER